MPERIEIERQQLALILDALRDAMVYRDSLDHAMVRMRGQREGAHAGEINKSHPARVLAQRAHRTKAKEYSELLRLLSHFTGSS